jgi:hypothetical protein
MYGKYSMAIFQQIFTHIIPKGSTFFSSISFPSYFQDSTSDEELVLEDVINLEALRGLVGRNGLERRSKGLQPLVTPQTHEEPI